MDTFPKPDLDTLHLRSHAEGVCRDYSPVLNEFSATMSEFRRVFAESMYEQSIDILCLMALTEALGLEYGGFA